MQMKNQEVLVWDRHFNRKKERKRDIEGKGTEKSQKEYLLRLA